MLRDVGSLELRGARRCLSLCAFALLFQSVGGLCKADEPDLRDSFRSEYRAAASKLENAYRHVKITGEYTKTDGRGAFLWTKHVEFLREGELARVEATTSKSSRSDAPVGSIQAFGGRREKYFEIAKTPDQTGYSINWFGSKENFDEQMLSNCFPAYVPYYFGGASVGEVLAGKDAQLVSAHPTKLGGADVVEVVIESQKPDGKRVRDRQLFLAGSWALTDSTMTVILPGGAVQLVARTTVSYEPGSEPPKVKVVDTWFETPDKRGEKHSRRTYEISSVEFGRVPPDRFTLAAYGVEEPALPTTRPRLFWILITSAAFFVGLGIWFAMTARRRRRAQSTGTGRASD